MVIRLELRDLLIIPVSLPLDGEVTFSDALFFVIDDPILVLFMTSAGFLLFRSQKSGLFGLRLFLTILFIPGKLGCGCQAHIGYLL